MDDSFWNTSRLYKVLNREIVELDFRSVVMEFHSRTPEKRIEWVLLVEWATGLRRLWQKRVGYVWNDELVLNIFWNNAGSRPLWNLYIKSDILNFTRSKIGIIFNLINIGRLGLLNLLFVIRRIARFWRIWSLLTCTLYVLLHI